MSEKTTPKSLDAILGEVEALISSIELKNYIEDANTTYKPRAEWKSRIDELRESLKYSKRISRRLCTHSETRHSAGNVRLR
jgi:hypothetical protein